MGSPQLGVGTIGSPRLPVLASWARRATCTVALTEPHHKRSTVQSGRAGPSGANASRWAAHSLRIPLLGECQFAHSFAHRPDASGARSGRIFIHNRSALSLALPPILCLARRDVKVGKE